MANGKKDNLFIITLSFENKKRARDHPIAYSLIWLPASDLTQNKQEQFTPSGREPSELLALCVNILPVFD